MAIRLSLQFGPAYGDAHQQQPGSQVAVPPAGTTPDAAVPRELCASRDVTMHVKISSTNQNRVKLRAGFFTKIEVRSNRSELRIERCEWFHTWRSKSQNQTQTTTQWSRQTSRYKGTDETGMATVGIGSAPLG